MTLIIVFGTDIGIIGTGIGDSGDQDKVSTLVFLNVLKNVKYRF